MSKAQYWKRKRVYGVGINDYIGTTKNNGVEIKEYRVWKDMLKRCYSELYKNKNKSYVDTKCCEEWLTFSNFIKDCETMKNAFCFGFDLDKDLMGDGLTYNKDTVCFLPSEINTTLGAMKGVRGNNLGIRFQYGKYYVRFNQKNKEVNLGRYENLKDAINVSKAYRESYIKILAEKWKDQLDIHAYEALMKYEVKVVN